MTTPLRIVFLGTPAFAVPTLQAVSDASALEVLGVITQPDKPAGRGQKLTPPPVKTLAESLGYPVFQPKSLKKNAELLDWLRAQAPDYLVTVAFGQILSQEVLDIPKRGTVNVHASLLPEYRGPNPIQRAILEGKTETGITTMLTDIGVDTGAMLLKEVVTIGAEETMGELTTRMSEVGAQLLVRTLVAHASGELQPTPQDEAQATHAPKCAKEDGLLDWTQSAKALDFQIRAFNPWPAATTMLNGERVKLLRSRLPENASKSGQPGQVLGATDKGILVATGQGLLEITSLQPPGKKEMRARDWFNGLRSPEELRFESAPVPAP